MTPNFFTRFNRSPSVKVVVIKGVNCITHIHVSVAWPQAHLSRRARFTTKTKMAASVRNVKFLQNLRHFSSRCLRKPSVSDCHDFYIKHCKRLNTTTLLLSRFSSAVEKEHCNIGTIGHVDHGKTTLTAAITKVSQRT